MSCQVCHGLVAFFNSKGGNRVDYIYNFLQNLENIKGDLICETEDKFLHGI